MKGKLTHFAIYANDIEKVAAFYQKVFNWSLHEYGPADFKQISMQENGQPTIIGAIQSVKYSPVPERVVGFECSIEVDDIDETAKMIQEAGGEILMKKTEIPHVGWIIKFRDTENGLACAVQYK